MTTSDSNLEANLDRLAKVERFFAQCPPEFGNLDIACLGAETMSADGAAALFLLLVYANLETNCPVFSRIHVVVGQGVELSKLVRELCLDMASHLNSNLDRDHFGRDFDRRVSFVEACSHEFEPFVHHLKDTPSKTAIVVMDAKRFRASVPIPRRIAVPGVKTPFGETTYVGVPENDWATALAEFASALRPIAVNRQTYVLLIAGEYCPVLDRNLDALRDSGATIYGIAPSESEAGVAKNTVRWMELMAGGHVEAVFSEIEGLGLSEVNTALLKAENLLFAGRGPEALELFRPWVNKARQECSSGTLVLVARMALYGGEPDQSLSILDTAIEKAPNDEMTLRMIHQHAHVLRAAHQQEQAFVLLERWFPNSHYTVSRAVERWLKERRYDKILDRLTKFEETDLSEFLRYAVVVATELGSGRPYEEVVAAVEAKVPALAYRALVHCSKDALNAGDIETAVQLVARITSDNEVGAEFAAELIIEAIRKWALSSPRGSDAQQIGLTKYEREFQALLAAMPLVLQYISDHPENGELRVNLSSALASDCLGAYGYGILVHLLAQTRPPTFVEVQPPVCPRTATAADLEGFIRKYFKDWDTSRPLLGAAEPIPSELQGERLDELHDAAAAYLEDVAQKLVGDPGMKPAMFMVFRIGCGSFASPQ